MRYETIADLYAANENAREHLIDTVRSISEEEEASALPDGEKWTIQQIIEHVSMVDSGIARICARLIEGAKAVGKRSDGRITPSPELYEKAAAIGKAKLDAPDRVQPSGDITITKALERLNENRPVFDAMRSDLETYDLSEPKFPHPYFGDLNAVEWLIVAGGHERRHADQIERLLAKIRT